MIPLAGSAYTYAYATLGEIFAWIIGWDLTLEYAMGASTVSSGWSNHFIEFLNIFDINIPLWLSLRPLDRLACAQNTVARQMTAGASGARRPAPRPFSGAGAISHRFGSLLDRAHELLARRICSVWRSASTFPLSSSPSSSPRFWSSASGERPVQRGHRCRQGHGGAVRHHPWHAITSTAANWGHDWHSFAPFGFSGIGSAAGVHLLRLHRLRCRLDHRPGGQESAARSAHRHHHLAAGLHGALYRGGRGAHRHGSLARDQYRAPIARAFLDRDLAGPHTSSPAARWPD